MSTKTVEMNRIETEARDWFLLQQERELSVEESRQYQQWLRLDELHGKAYQQLEDIWQGLGELELNQQSDSSSSWFSAIAHFFSDSLAGFRRFTLATPFAMASIVGIIMVSTLWLANDLADTDYMIEYRSDIAQVKTIKLDDGSLLTLGADTQLEVSFQGNRRDVRLLKGQAFFDVAKDKQRPFYVDAEKAGVMVVGTRFEVYKQLDRVKVTVEEGMVKVAPTAQDDFSSLAVKTLTAGQRLVSNASVMGEVSVVDSDSVSPWRDGRLVYRDAALENVVFDINRYRQAKIILGTESLKKLKVTTSLSVDQTGSVVSMLEQSLPVVAHKETDDRILILPKSSLM